MPAVPLDEAVRPLVLAIDIGTSSVRALLFDRSANAVAGSETQIEYALDTTPDGGASTPADGLFELVATCVDGVLEFAGSMACDIEAVGISCFWHSLLGLDANGEPTTAVLLWADTRSAPDAEALRVNVDRPDLHARTGTVIHSSFWPAKLRWLNRVDPATLAKTTSWCAFSDYLLRRTHGERFTSVSMASGTGMLNVQTADWDSEAIRVVGVDPGTLPPIAPEKHMARGLVSDLAHRWGALVEVPWLLGLGDGVCANVGAGAVRNARIALSLGTSGAMRVIVDAPTGLSLAVPDDLWAYRLDRQRAILGAAISNGGKVLTWLHELLNASFDDADMEAVGALEPDSHGLTVLPFLAGERSPIWNDRATAVIAGLSLDTSRADLLRAGMESVSLRLARIYAALAKVASPQHEVVASGGAILRSPLWLQMTADALAHPLVALDPDEEASARGAAIVAMEAAGIINDIDDVNDPAVAGSTIEPNRHHVAAYKGALERQRFLERMLFPDGTSWDQIQASEQRPAHA